MSRIEINGRDVDVPLSERGLPRRLRWVAGLLTCPDERPQVILSSPYGRAEVDRARRPTRRVCGTSVPRVIDERLREKEFGVLDRLTREASRPLSGTGRNPSHLGKFYHRPPGGESWCDVILRMRSAVHTLASIIRDLACLVVAHQVLVLCLRYLLEDLEAEVLAIDGQGTSRTVRLPNISMRGSPATKARR